MSIRRPPVFLRDFLITCSGSRLTVMRMNYVCRTSSGISCYFWALGYDRWRNRADQSLRGMKANLHVLPRSLRNWTVLHSGCRLVRVKLVYWILSHLLAVFSESFLHRILTKVLYHSDSDLRFTLCVRKRDTETISSSCYNVEGFSCVYSYLIGPKRKKKVVILRET
jgi:hypothetical protein